MHDNHTTSEGRIVRFLGEVLPRRRHLATAALTIEAWEAPGEPVPFAEATAQQYRPIAVGDRWGRPWSTLWLHVTGTVPAAWAEAADTEAELQLDLSFSNMPGFQAEAMVWGADGVPVKAVNPFNQYLTVRPGERLDLYLECAANPNVTGTWNFAPTNLGTWEGAGDDPIYDLTRLCLALRSVPTWALEQDLVAVSGLMRELPRDSARRWDLLRAAERALDAADLDQLHSTATAARAELADVLAATGAAGRMTVIATGHAHIDSAWLWPVRETRRKCARTFANVCWLLERHPQLNFSCSSAQQYAWIKEDYPELFERIAGHVRAGRFIPVGGMWVESDTNMPGSEAMARQFIQGKSFFLENFGIETTNTWLPDSFGYSAALPQICAAAGNRDFLTQKVSWNQYSTFPHHTFWWEGIDGTRQFTHFPPSDTYNGQLTAAELHHVETNFKDKGDAHLGLTPTGWGDGGGGPTREMIASAERFADVDGLPRVEWSTPDDFFARARSDYADPPTWRGELYLELHRGTYSSQIRGKQGNRRAEGLLHDVELWSATAALRDASFAYPYAEIARLWEDVLLLQFHDILPGSSIAWVHQDSEHSYASIQARGEALVTRALSVLGADATGSPAVTNGTSRAVAGVPALAAGPATPVSTRPQVSGVTAPLEIDTENLHVQIETDGTISSLRAGADGREAIAPGSRAALLQLHRDQPNAWDSWDIDEHYRRTSRDLEADGAPAVTVDDDGTVRVRTTYRTRPDGVDEPVLDDSALPSRGRGSEIALTVVVRPGADAVELDLDLDWHERRKVLKVAFGLDLRAADMASETQFGHLRRPVPVNTLEDFGRFETCAHRWVHVGEPGYGVALANDSSYGHDVRHVVRESDGGTTTIVRATAIRAAEFPDPRAEEGTYRLRYALRPDAGIAEAIDLGEALNRSERTVAGEVAAVATLSEGSARIQTVKLAEDASGDLVVRLYESEGRRQRAELTAPGFARAIAVDLLERPFGAHAPLARRAQEAEGDSIVLDLNPFEIATVRFGR
ncbi:alpha-mannosidase [Occultella kanbiaonis]|uniref:alpha-mannosidase n=1 Tax=Occultella kanbiaonis TaxID=2675754 RepID=UPI0013D1C09C|nr:alpha-mannosidase [Occultella kanbiaonis]